MATSPKLLLTGATILASTGAACHPAAAQDASAIASIERQIGKLKSELAGVRREEADRRAEAAEAQSTAREARLEAQQANQRALSMSGGQSFSGASAGGLYQPSGSGNPPGVFQAQDLPRNGLGPHLASTAGEQQASALGPYGRFQLGGVSITLGGYIEALGIVRSRNEVGDFASNFNSAPYPQSPTYHEPEFRGSSRSSRFSLLIEGKPSTAVRVAGYFETDFGTAGISSNSNESNSYALRLRQAYATYDNDNWGFHFLGGQAFSMLSVDRIGITPRQEALPLVPDGNAHVGYWYTRQWQLRFVKDFDDHRLWAGLSFEAPETLYSVVTQNVAGTNDVGGVIGGQSNFYNLGGSLLNSTANYADDVAPDIIAKLAADPSFGHYELYGIARFMNARDVSTTSIDHGGNRTVLAGGGGAAMLLPIVGRKLVFQAQGLVGQGIGRYGPGQLPDATINQTGTPIPIPEVQALLGLVGHPDKAIDLYAYVGTEQEQKRSFNERVGGVTYAYGLGNGRFIDTGCETEGSAAATCSGQTHGLVEGTLGGWWRFLHGPYGTMEVGPSWSYTRRTAFQGTSVATAGKVVTDSEVTPKTDENTVLLSFRYLPFL